MAAVINLKLTVMTINEMESQKLSDDADYLHLVLAHLSSLW